MPDLTVVDEGEKESRPLNGHHRQRLALEKYWQSVEGKKRIEMLRLDVANARAAKRRIAAGIKSAK